jgi:hypothetical protein
MRKATMLLLGAALIVAGPAAAQDNATTNTPATTADPLATPDANGVAVDPLATDPALANGMATDPAAADPMATDPALAVPPEQDEDNDFPWGLLGLLGLAGLIPRKRRDDRVVVDRDDRTTR